MKIGKKILVPLFLILFVLLVSPSFAVPPPAPVGGVGIVIHGTNSSKNQYCGNTDSSCGVWPNCFDLTSLKYCVNERVVESYCFSNSIRNRTRSTPCQDINIIFNVTDSNGVEESADVDLYAPDTETLMESLSISGEDSLNSTRDIVDMMFKYDGDNFKFKIKSLSLSKIALQITRITFDIINPDIPNHFIIRAYKVELPQNFSYSSIKLFIKYDSNEVKNISSLSLFKCINYDINDEECDGNWIKINFTIDQTNYLITANITGFSAYVLGELENNPAPNPTPAPSPAQSPAPSSSPSPAPAPTTNPAPRSTTPTTNNTTIVNTSAPQETERNQTQNITLDQPIEENQTPPKTTGLASLAIDKTHMIILAVSVPSGIVAFFYLKKHKLGKGYNNFKYTRGYKKRYAQTRKSKQVKEEIRLILP